LPVVGRLAGREAVRVHFAAIFAAMPDFHIDAERIAADGETVFVHWRLTGTFTVAPFLGIEPTDRAIDLRGTDCFTVREGKVVANFIAYDGIDLAVQAGILPPHGSRMDHAMTIAANWMTRARKKLHR
jgi:predicted ester cyclase